MAAYDSDRQGRPTASVAELTGMLDLSGWPKGIRVIVHGRARPRRPTAQPRFTDVRGGRFLYASDTKHGQLAHLALRHRRCARCEDEIIPQPPKTPAWAICLPDYTQIRIGCKLAATPANCSPGSNIRKWLSLALPFTITAPAACPQSTGIPRFTRPVDRAILSCADPAVRGRSDSVPAF